MVDVVAAVLQPPEIAAVVHVVTAAAVVKQCASV